MRSIPFICIVLISLLGVSLGARVRTKSATLSIIDQCLPLEGLGNVCVQASSVDCFELNAKLTVDNKTYFDQTLPLPGLVRQVKAILSDPPKGMPKNVVCYRLDPKLGIGYCDICANVTELHIDGDDFTFAGSVNVSCNSTFAGTFERSFDVPRVDIKDCKLFGCPNNCTSHGTCDSFGFCTCEKGFSGPDCSAFIDQNSYCITSDFVGKTCWETYFPDCHTIEFKVTVGGREPVKIVNQISKTGSLQLMPPMNMTGFDACAMSVVATNISVVQDVLDGCPSLQVTCDGAVVESFPYGCMRLAQSKSLICSPGSETNAPSDGSKKSERLGTARVIMWVAIGGFVLALLIAGGYFVFSRFIRKSDANYGYDVVSLNAADDDDDVAPLRSPFAGSSDDD